MKNYGIWISLTVLCLLSNDVAAQGGLSVTPKRVEFQGNQRSADVYLLNRSSETRSYSLNFVEYNMAENGGLERVLEPIDGQYFASDHIRFFPRRVTLGPGESQTVRLQLRQPRDEEVREYRSHLVFRAIPDARPLGYADDDDDGLNIRIDAIYGISIPVIFRSGDQDVNIEIDRAELDLSDVNDPRIRVVLSRTGSHSSFGDITIVYEHPNGENIIAGHVKGVAVYTPTPQRSYRVKIRNSEALDMENGRFIIRYRYNEDRRSRQESVAEYQLDL